MTAPEHKIEYLSQTGTSLDAEDAVLAATIRVSSADGAVLATSRLTWKAAKPPKAPRVPKDPLAELVDVIRTVKAALALPWDESATRVKLADPVFRRAAKREPHVAAEFARRKAAATPETATPDTVAVL